MLAISTGKLVRYLVEDGGHINADQPYAEIEASLRCLPPALLFLVVLCSCSASALRCSR